MEASLSHEYVAGLMDGEGTITLTKKNNRHSARVSIAQSNQGFLEMIREFMGGYGGVYHQKGSECWSWVVASRDGSTDVLLTLEPFLILKKQQSILVREFIGLSRNIGRTKPYTDRMMDIISDVRVLNRRPSLSKNFA